MNEGGPSPADPLRADRAERQRREENELHTQANLEALQGVHSALDLNVLNEVIFDFETADNVPDQPTDRPSLSHLLDDLENAGAAGYNPQTEIAERFEDMEAPTGDPGPDKRRAIAASIAASAYCRAVFDSLMVVQPPSDDAERKEYGDLLTRIADLQKEAVLYLLDTVHREEEKDDKALPPDWETVTVATLQTGRSDIKHNANLRIVSAAAAVMEQARAQFANGYIKTFGFITEPGEPTETKLTWAQRIEQRTLTKWPRRVVGGLGVAAVLGGIAASGGPEVALYGSAMLAEGAVLIGSPVLASFAKVDYERQGTASADEKTSRESLIKTNGLLRELAENATVSLIDYTDGLMAQIARKLRRANLGKSFINELYGDRLPEPPAETSPSEEAESAKAKEISRRGRIRAAIAAGTLVATVTVVAIDASAVKDQVPVQKGKPDTVPVVTADTSVEAGNAEDCRILGATNTTIIIRGQRTSCP